jgi:membrane-bound serine protease (ClpP class)
MFAPSSYRPWAGLGLAAVLILAALCSGADAAAGLQPSSGDWQARIFNFITMPDVAFLLLLAGIYGLLIETGHPGVYFPGVIGAISLTLAVIAMTGMPVDFGALALLLLGIALMGAEMFTPGIGALGIGGFAAFIAGASFLFGAASGPAAVSIPVVVGSALVCAGLTFFVIGAAVKARRRPVATGGEAMIGASARVIEWKGGEGSVLMSGERWRASGEPSLKAGDAVRVVARDGLTLTVERE